MGKERTKIYINGRLVGFYDNPLNLIKELKNARRNNKIDSQINISYDENTNEIYVNTDGGRVQRPLIVVQDGKSLLTDELLNKVKKGEMSFDDLVSCGVIEYLDAEEEENAFIAKDESELTKEHTHLEISPLEIFSVISSMIPYLPYNMSGKALHGAKMFKQAAGLNALNYRYRTDTEGFFLYYPQKSMVRSKTMDIIKLDQRPQTQNFVVAIMPFYGFNMMDAVILNKGAIERALGRTAYFRTYESVQKRYPGGQRDKFEVPDAETVGYLGEQYYKKLGEDGLAEVEMQINENEAIVGKTSPPRFLEEVSEFGVVKEKRTDVSTTIKKEKTGYVDRVLITEDLEGNTLAKIKIRSERIPEVGDKFSSRHGQKGVVGAIIPEEDMPFTADGIKPDLILNPHSIPSRMTIGHLLETLAGKAASIEGKDIDATPFAEMSKEQLMKMLADYGLRSDGRETFYDGITGERIEGDIFVGVVAYHRLYHMVRHKIQARARGPVQILTRQPTEGKEKEGGLRFGEMEGETLVGHGASMLLHEKYIDSSDKVSELVCERCGLIAVNDRIRNRRFCPVCQGSKVYPVEMSYGFKLMLDELKSLGIYPKLHLSDKV